MKRQLANWITAYMEYTRATESPDAYHFWTAVSVLGAATARQVSLGKCKPDLQYAERNKIRPVTGQSNED